MTFITYNKRFLFWSVLCSNKILKNKSKCSCTDTYWRKCYNNLPREQSSLINVSSIVFESCWVCGEFIGLRCFDLQSSIAVWSSVGINKHSIGDIRPNTGCCTSRYVPLDITVIYRVPVGLFCCLSLIYWTHKYLWNGRLKFKKK